jgi:hypothetical protein
MNHFRKAGAFAGGTGLVRSASALALIALLAGCGGGGGSSAATDTTAGQQPNAAADTSLTYVSDGSTQTSDSATSNADSGATDSVTDTTKTTAPAQPDASGNGTVQLPPEFAKWEKDMITYGKKWGDYISNASSSNRLDAVYYDGQWIYYQIADYTGNAEPWNSYARAAEQVYRDGYLKPNNYKVPGYWRFPHGIYEDYKRGSDATVDQIAAVRDNPSFSEPAFTDYSWKWYHAKYSREIAYAIHANLTAEKAGLPRQESRMQAFMKMAENQLDQWRRGDYSYPYINEPDQDRLKPFMFALTAHALIDFYEWEKQNGRDPNAYFNDILGTLSDFAKWMFNEARNVNGQRLWVGDVGGSAGAWNANGGTGYGAFRYADKGNSSELNPAPDLNLLIAPAYAWLYKETGDSAFRTMADKIFSGGVMMASTQWNGKIFDQNYRWSFKYVQWRKDGDKQWN